MVYTHHSVKSFEYLIIPVLQEIIKNNNTDFLDLTDSFVLNYVSNSSIKNTLKHNIYTRQVPKLINEITIQKQNIISKLFDETFYQSLLTTFDIFDSNKEDYIIERTLIGFSNNVENPLNNIYYYDNNENDYISLVNPQNYSFIIPEIHNELILRLYSKEDKPKKFCGKRYLELYFNIFKLKII